MYTFEVIAINGKPASTYSVIPAAILDIKEYKDGMGITINGSEVFLEFENKESQDKQVAQIIQAFHRIAMEMRKQFVKQTEGEGANE